MRSTFIARLGRPAMCCLAAAALDELLHILRDDAPARATAAGLRDVHSSICCKLPGIGARHYPPACVDTQDIVWSAAQGLRLL